MSYNRECQVCGCELAENERHATRTWLCRDCGDAVDRDQEHTELDFDHGHSVVDFEASAFDYGASDDC